jgi:hypothetical protein
MTRKNYINATSNPGERSQSVYSPLPPSVTTLSNPLGCRSQRRVINARYSAGTNYILDQIERAFRTKPNLAGTLHGQRKIHQGGKGHRTSLFPSRKAGGAIPLESSLELSHALELERCQIVQDYRVQSIKIHLSGGTHSFPDFLVLTKNGAIELHEVKPSILHLTTEQKLRFDALEAITNNLGIELKKIDAKTLRQGTELSKLIHLYNRGHIKKWTAEQIKLGSNILENTRPGDISAYLILSEQNLPEQIADYLWFHQNGSTGKGESHGDI